MELICLDPPDLYEVQAPYRVKVGRFPSQL